MNTKKLLSSKSAEHLRKTYNASDEDIIATELFYRNRYGNNTSIMKRFDKYEPDSLEWIDLNDYYLRATEDQEVIPLTIDQVATYLLTRYYSCNSGNFDDYNYLYQNLNLNKFVNNCYKEKLADNLVKVGRQFYLIEDDYILNRRMNGYLF